MEIKEKQIHEHGFVRLIDVMGDDNCIADAARVSYGKGTRSASDNRNLIRYLLRHKHTSPLEMVEVKFHLKLPIFIMRQLVRHRTASLNEYSGRYSIMTEECYEPSDEYLKPQSQANKQGSDGDLPKTCKDSYKQKINGAINKAIVAYRFLLGTESATWGGLGLSRELARTVLPVSNYTECYWKIDLHNFFHFCRLRMDSHAQQEIRDYAKVMYEMVKPEVPIASEAFEDYSLNSVSLSRMEVDVLQYAFKKFPEMQSSSGFIQNITSYISKLKNDDNNFGMSNREWKELEEKLK
jgi:thymidylate synthase (FAD)